MKTKYLLALAVLLASFLQVYHAQVSPIPAHAHNDYNHKQPLLDALSKGFTSIEVDVFPIDGKLYVAHDYPAELDKSRTLEALYLKPLDAFLTEHGKLYEPDTALLQLMIDIKQHGGQAYAILRPLLEKYAHMIWHLEDSAPSSGRIRVVLSGDRPFELVLADSMAYMGLDGRPSDLGKGYSATYMPMISQHMRSVISWDGKGPISSEDQNTLTQLSQHAHAEGKTVRLWATPENENLWDNLIETGIDWINTDNLAQLHTYLTQEE